MDSISAGVSVFVPSSEIDDSDRTAPTGAKLDPMVPPPHPATVPPNQEAEYPAFSAPEYDPSPILNAMFSIFTRAATQSGAPAGSMGPISYSFGGFLAHFQQAHFMPLTLVAWPPPTSRQPCRCHYSKGESL